MNDKLFGYLILAVLTGCFCAVVGYSISVLVFPKEERIITFDQVSNLRVDDPVQLKGTTVATISEITKGEKKVIVTIKLFKPLTVYKGYRIYNSDKGILGDQQIIFENGDAGNTVIDAKDTLTAVFHPGVSDVLGLAWKLQALIISFRENAGVMLTGSSDKKSLITTFNDVTASIDTVSQKIATIATTLNREVTHAVDTLNSIASTARDFSREMTDSIPTKLRSLDNQIQKLVTFVEKLDTLENSLSRTVLTIKDNNLLTTDQITPLMNQLDEINNFIEMILNGTARLKVRLHAGFE